MVKRRKQSVREATLDYLVNLYLNEDNVDNYFTSKTLREFCFIYCDEHDPQEPVHALRYYKKSGMIDYTCTNRGKGEYQLTFMNICIDTIENLDVEPLVITGNGTLH